MYVDHKLGSEPHSIVIFVVVLDCGIFDLHEVHRRTMALTLSVSRGCVPVYFLFHVLRLLASPCVANSLHVRIVELVQDVVSVLLLPLYFAVSGLKTDLTLLDSATLWGICALTISAACLGKESLKRFFFPAPINYVMLVPARLGRASVGCRGPTALLGRRPG